LKLLQESGARVRVMKENGGGDEFMFDIFDT
jgi:hypothetical protein